ncbi:MAG TPA: O-antigen ligase family protein [Methyloceanibacter sp.]|nr:O-antigen ligase family protein [Methyloceanibacter sp.]
MSNLVEQAPPVWWRRPFLPVLGFTSPFFTSIAPQGTWIFFILFAVTLVVAAFRWQEWRRLIRPDATFGVFLLLVAYVFLSAIWAVAPQAALFKGALLLGVVVAVYAAGNAAAGLDAWQLRRTALAFAAGAFAGALFVLFEILTSGLFTRSLLDATPFFETPKRVRMIGNDVVSIAPGAFRQNAGLVVLHFWPALLAMTVMADRVRRKIATGLVALATAMTALISRRMSAVVGLSASALIFPVTAYWRRDFLRLLAALWCLAFVAVLPLSFLAYDAELHMAPWLERSARVRVIIWEYTAERVLDRPWIGIGAESTVAAQDQAGPPEQPEGFVYPRMTGPHAHNLFLQTWYELGVVGAVLVALAGAMLLLSVLRLPAAIQPYAAATFVAFATMLGFAWGMWQTWLICAAGLIFLYLRIAAAAAEWAASHNEAPVRNQAEAPLGAGPVEIA